MNRRAFLAWLGGGVAATVALSKGQVASAEELFRVAHKFDPEKSLYVPDEPVIALPDEKRLVIATEAYPVGVAVYRVSNPAGTFWFDAERRFLDATDRGGRPMSVLLTPEGVRDSWGRHYGDLERMRNRLKRTSWPRTGVVYEGQESLARWDGLLPPDLSKVVAKILLEAAR